MGVVSGNADAQLDDEVNVAPPPRPAALITVTAHEVAPAATRQAQVSQLPTRLHLRRTETKKKIEMADKIVGIMHFLWALFMGTWRFVCNLIKNKVFSLRILWLFI